MTLTLALELVRKIGPWVALALLAAGLGVLVLDRNHLAALNDRRLACTASASGKPNSKPPSEVCDPPISTAVLAAAQAASCDSGLAALASGAPATCSAAVQHVVADRDARAAEVADRDQQLAQARQTQAAAVSRATVRATAQAKEAAHAQTVVTLAPRDAAGDLVFDADRLRDLAGPDPSASAPGGGDGHPR